ncbi:MAG: STAS-like domain-containing protein [Elusimicrobia bacterium]|nr:STAS-like domain-containing protein [Elusimicrobiota bacterium]
MKQIDLYPRVGAFAENKDIARSLRTTEIIPALEAKEEVLLNFERVEAATQSFIHALISDVLRKFGNDVLDRLEFKSCNETVRKIITIVVDYMQEGMDAEPPTEEGPS